MLKANAPVPSASLKLVSGDDINVIDTKEYFSSGTFVVFAVPGAFTPTCSNDHLPGYLALSEDFEAAEVNRIVCLTVNDHHVTSAWAKDRYAAEKIDFLADPHAEFSKALEIDTHMADLGVRASRSAFIVRDGVVLASFVAGERGKLGDTSAQAVLAALRSQS